MAYDILKISAKTNGRCFYCGSQNNLQVDHFVSRKKWDEWLLDQYVGSRNETENLFLACRHCNASKRDKNPEDFIGNSFLAWSRYVKANHRIGLSMELTAENLYGE